MTPIIGADYLYSNIFTFENGPAYKALSNQQEKINPEKFKRLQKALENIYSYVMDSIQSEKNLVKTSKELSHKLQSITTDVEKQTSQSYHDNSMLGDLKRELLKTQNEVSLCQDKETKYISELQQNEKQRAELLADIEQIRQHKVDMLEPQLVATNKELRVNLIIIIIIIINNHHQ